MNEICFEIVVFGASDGVFDCTVNEFSWSRNILICNPCLASSPPLFLLPVQFFLFRSLNIVFLR